MILTNKMKILNSKADGKRKTGYNGANCLKCVSGKLVKW